MSTRPLTCKKTAAADDTEKMTHPDGRASVGERTDSEEIPLPESDLID